MKPLLQILHIAKLSVYSLALSGVLVSCSDLLRKILLLLSRTILSGQVRMMLIWHW